MESMLTSLMVLCDGFQSSIKGVEFAGLPGMLLRRHEGTELVLLHVCDNKEALHRSNDAAVNAAGSHPHVGAASSALLSSDEIVQHALAMCTNGSNSGSFINMTNLSSNAEAPNTTDEQNKSIKEKSQVSLPSFLVIYNTLTAIQKNKVLAGKLNYKLMTSLLSGAASWLPISEDEDAEGKCGAATAVATYAATNARQYNTNTIVLGAGNIPEGKTLRVGAVAKRVLQLKKDFFLYFMKANGLTLRVSTARVFYMVLVPVMVQDDDNDGKAEEQLQAGVDAVNYALQRRRAQGDGAAPESLQHFKDVIAVTLVVEPDADPSKTEQYKQTFEGILNSENLRRIDLENGVKEQNDTDVKNNVEARAGDTPEEEVNKIPSTEVIPMVSTCMLKPSKANRHPTVRNASAQATKFASSFKPSFLVTASVAPGELHLCMLKELKYHCIIVPKQVQK
ncbi:unnamed protein product [Phytomonas sp. Hart1]|nr:unnamed protein product [Phytomonas sp. Hart1]|eukprot:CCW67687.1 unnamed protein product [Phytomonas sp. isolate Hart1]